MFASTADPSALLTQTKLAVANLDVYYGAFHAIRNASLEVPAHRVMALIGPSGCGKTTFIRALNRMHDLTPGARVEGKVLLDDRNIYAPGVDPVTIRYRIGMVFQRPNPFPKSIFDNVVYGPRIQGERGAGKLMEICERSLVHAALWDEVKDRLDRSALALSGGQQQRLCIARCLAIDPEVILMDEPASALDPIATAKIEDLIEGIEEIVHGRHRDALNAAGGPRQRQHRLLSARRTRRNGYHGDDLHQTERQAHRRLHQRPVRINVCRVAGRSACVNTGLTGAG